MIEVQVGTDINAAVAGIHKLEAELNKIPAALAPVSAGMAKATAAVDSFANKAKSSIVVIPPAFRNVEQAAARVPAAIAKVEHAAIRLNQTMAKVAPTTNSANLALINTGRVFQDLPFGILGVANNLNPLLESMQRASAQAKETGTSLSSNLLGALKGGGGLGLALSIVSSALIVFADKLGLAGRTFREADFEGAKFSLTLIDLKKRMDDFKSSLEFSQLLSNLRFQIGGGEGFALDIFDINATKVKNEKFIAEAKKQVGEIDDTLAELTKKVVERGGEATDLFSRFAFQLPDIPENLISKLSTKNQQIFNDLKKFAKQKEDLNKQSLEAATDIASGELRLDLRRVQNTAEQAKKLEELRKKNLAEFEKFRDQTISKARQFASEFGNAFVVPDLSDSFLKTKDQIFNASKKLLDDVNSKNLKVKVPVDIDFDLVPPQVGLPAERIGKAWEEAARSISGIQLEPFVFDPSIIVAMQDEKALEDFKKQLAGLQKNLNISIQTFLSGIAIEGLATVGEAIGTAIAGGDVKGVFESFANTIGDGLQALGKEFIKFGVLGELAKKALKSFALAPGLAIAAGIALIAAGAALKSALGGGIKARAKGGPVNPGEPYLVGERGPEIIVPRYSGTVLPNHSASGIAGAMGNKAAMQPIVMGVEWSGDVFRLIQKRSEKRAGRSYG